jgi:hypothetical protein
MAAGAERTDGTPRTIEEIEQRAALIHRSERDAFDRLAAFLRELAVELPPESRLPIRFAEAANRITQLHDTGALAARIMEREVQEYELDEVDAWIAELARWRGRKVRF